MYKKLLSALLILIISLTSTGLHALESQSELSDTILSTLTYDDFSNAYIILHNDHDLSELTERERNKLATRILVDIHQAKSNSVTPSYLPVDSSTLNEAEKELVKANPIQATGVFHCATLANRYTNNRYQSYAIYNDNGDAFRHMVWNALMTKDFSLYGTQLSHGRSIAKLWSDAHENYSSNPPLEKSMDLHNNNIGRNLVTLEMHSNDLISSACFNAVRSGKGLRLLGGFLRPTNGDGLK